MVEPLDGPFAALSAAAATRPGFIPVQALCASREGVTFDFHVASNGGQSSSLLAPKRVLEEYPKVRFSETLTLTSTTADRVLEQAEAAHPQVSAAELDILYIDTQGAELRVMMGASRVLQHVRYIWTEVSYDLYEGGASLEEMQGFLQPFGFRLNNLYVNAHGWGDALFIRR